MEKQKDIYDLELHEETVVYPDVQAMRVPGGWLYIFVSNDIITATQFVPYSGEFAMGTKLPVQPDTGIKKGWLPVRGNESLFGDVMKHNWMCQDEDGRVSRYNGVYAGRFITHFKPE